MQPTRRSAGKDTTIRVAALYDIHANLPALEAVLEEVRAADVDLVVVGGDVVPGPMPRETAECLLDSDLPLQFIQGNGDREVLAAMRGQPTAAPEPLQAVIHWNAGQLHDEYVHVLESWPSTLRLETAALGEILFCHATPRSDTEIFTRQTAEAVLRPLFDGLRVPLVVCGHTHMPFDRTVGATRVVNAGSVGMPFGQTGAHWLLLGTSVEFRRTGYDLGAAAARIRRTACPQAEEFAARNVLQCPGEEEMLAVFARTGMR